MLKFLFYIILVGLLTIGLPGCEDEVNKEAPPARVVLVEKNPDTSAVERGIDALYEVSRPEVNSIILEWHPNLETTLAGYSIFRSESIDKNYVAIVRIGKAFNFIDTTFIDNSVSLQKRYYYFIKAFDEFDQFSDPSDTVNYKLVEIPSLSSPVGNIGNNFSPIFAWDFHPNYIPHTFIFRLEKIENEAFNPLYTKLLELGVDYDPHQEWTLSSLTSVNSLSAGIYRWRIDPLGSEALHGAESAWREFSIQ
jgi:hypothetical protein